LKEIERSHSQKKYFQRNSKEVMFKGSIPKEIEGTHFPEQVENQKQDFGIIFDSMEEQ